MSRPSRQLVLMQSAFLWAQRSTCSRLHVGCVIERDGRILVQGYNGAPAGLPHCDHGCTCGRPNERGWAHSSDCNSQSPCTRAVHAEQNAISFAARHGVGLNGATAWITNQPCMSCAQSLINTGIVQVYFMEAYRLQDGTELLKEAGIEVWDAGLLFPDWVDRMPK